LKSFLHTPLCDLLGCRYPVIQTAMGWVADARLVAATCNAGGFGFLAAATLKAAEAEQAILEIKSLTSKPFGVNFHMFQPDAGAIVEAVLRHGVRAVSYGRGPQPEVVRRLRDAGVVCMPTVGLPRHAVKAVELGAQALVVQGHEGGGHTGPVPTSVLLPQVLRSVEVPVVAAGGFHDGRSLVAALAYGAQGIAMGTRFMMTTDSPVPEATQARYLEVKDATRIVVSQALDGLPQRLVENEQLKRLERAGALRKLIIALRSAWRYRRLSGASLGQLLRAALASRRSGLTMAQAMMSANAPMIIQEAMVHGQPDQGALPSGQVASSIHELLSCEQLLEQLMDEAGQCLAELGELNRLSTARGQAGPPTEKPVAQVAGQG